MRKLFWISVLCLSILLLNFIRLPDINLNFKSVVVMQNIFRHALLPVERHCKPRICKSVLTDAVQGKWIPKEDLSEETIHRRLKEDSEIRKRNDWPVELYRNDSRCGTKFPIPSYEVNGQCDPNSSSPCCQLRNGRCGNSSLYCKCVDCIDTRRYLAAEHSTWHPNDVGCRIKHYDYKEACQLLGNNVKHILVTGDSLIRQLFTTMMMYFTNDYEHGAHLPNATAAERKLCRGEYQIVDHECRYKFPHLSLDVPRFCNRRQAFTLELIEHYKPLIIDDVKNGIKKLLGKNNTYVILSIGLHFHLKYDEVIEKYLKPIIQLIRNQGRDWPRLIWLGIHSVNEFLRQKPFLNKDISSYNQHVHAYLAKHQVPVIDFYSMSRLLRSYDDLHYTMGFNLHKIQLILNYFEELYERCPYIKD